MESIKELIIKLENDGYSELNAMSRVSQDILLKAIKDSGIENNITIKGGVLMRNISKDIRRATIDLDIDFVRLSISDEMVDKFVSLLNENSAYVIKIVDEIEELKHEDYKGKRVYVNIEDNEGNIANSKIDIGVHVYSNMELEECIFFLFLEEEGISLLANSKEQVIAEKLKSLLKFGTNSTRYKDIFDIEYLLDSIDKNKLEEYKKILIYDNTKYNDTDRVHARLKSIFENKKFVITGTISFMPRNEIKKEILKRGGKVIDSVSSKTDIVIVGDSPGSKYDKARKLNIEIWDENKLKEKL